MSSGLLLISLSFIIILFIVITMFVRKDSISIKYSLIWYSSLFVLFFLIISPTLLKWITNLFKIQVASNLIFAMIIGILFVVTISLTIIASKQKEQIKLLVQEVSVLKKKIGEKK